MRFRGGGAVLTGKRRKTYVVISYWVIIVASHRGLSVHRLYVADADTFSILY